MAKTFPKSLLSILGYSIVLFVYYGGVFFLICMYFGGFYLRLFLLSLYGLQLFCKRTELFRRFMTYLEPHDYFYDNGTIFEEETPFSEKKNLVCFHPHGILATLLPLNELRSKHFNSFQFLATRVLNYAPLGGIPFRLLGVGAVEPKTFDKLLGNDENIAFLPGGFEEATITDPKQDKVWILNRKGFIKYGLKYGYNIYPAYSFNENKLFYCFTYFESFRLFLNRWKFPGCLFIGKYWLWPSRDIKSYTVVGKKIKLPKLEKITQEDINKYHQIYIDGLIEIYDKYKVKFGGSEKLLIR